MYLFDLIAKSHLRCSIQGLRGTVWCEGSKFPVAIFRDHKLLMSLFQESKQEEHTCNEGTAPGSLRTIWLLQVQVAASEKNLWLAWHKKRATDLPSKGPLLGYDGTLWKGKRSSSQEASWCVPEALQGPCCQDRRRSNTNIHLTSHHFVYTFLVVVENFHALRGHSRDLVVIS